MMKFIQLILVSILIVGCGKTIPTKELEQKGIFYAPGTDSNVLIYRVSTIFGVGEGARVNFNGENIGYLYSGNRAELKLPRGRHTFIVDSPASFGKCDITFDLKEGDKKYLEVKPLGAITGLFVRGVIGKEIASSVESTRNECSGGYQINLLTASEAKANIKATKLTGFSN